MQTKTKYQNMRTVPQSIQKIVETGGKSIPLCIHIYEK